MRAISFLGLLIFCATGYAADSCSMKAVKLLAAGDPAALSAMFADSADISAAMADLSVIVGTISGLEEVESPRSRTHHRVAVQSKLAGSQDKYRGAWFNGDSKKLGPVQVHVAMGADVDCKLVGIFVDYPR